MLKNKWVTYAVIIFFIYSYAKQQLTSKPVAVTNGVNYQETVKSVDITEDKKVTKIEDKQSVSAANKKASIATIEVPEDAGIMQQKIIGFANQIINGPIGQKITEAILISASKNPKDPNSKPLPYHNLTKNDLIEGQGEQVKCGQRVKTHIIVKLSDGSTYLNTHLTKKPVSFTVGQEEVIRGIEYNVIGMAKEGYRKVFIPPSQAYDNPKFSTPKIAEGEFINLEIELLDLSPLIDSKINKIVTNSYVIGPSQNIYRCGDRAGFLYKIKNTENNVVYYSSNNNNPTFGKIGYKDFPYIFTWALEAMPLASKKTISFPSEMLKNIDGENTNFFQPIANLPSNLTLEIETLERK